MCVRYNWSGDMGFVFKFANQPFYYGTLTKQRTPVPAKSIKTPFLLRRFFLSHENAFEIAGSLY